MRFQSVFLIGYLLIGTWTAVTRCICGEFTVSSNIPLRGMDNKILLVSS